MKAKVTEWNDSKGFGFVSTDTGRKVFVHYSSIISEAAYKTLAIGSDVELECYETPMGYEGRNVKKL